MLNVSFNLTISRLTALFAYYFAVIWKKSTAWLKIFNTHCRIANVIPGSLILTFWSGVKQFSTFVTSSINTEKEMFPSEIQVYNHCLDSIPTQSLDSNRWNIKIFGVFLNHSSTKSVFYLLKQWLLFCFYS